MQSQLPARIGNGELSSQGSVARGSSRRPAALASDESGATLVMGVFMAAFLVAMVYYVLGLGQTVLYKESMQDAADTASFGAAVVHARGMNMLALLNMLMAAVLAVLVALETAVFILFIAWILAILECMSGYVAACFMIPVYMSGMTFISDHIGSVRESILDVVRATGAVERVVAQEIPIAAAAKVRQYGEVVYDPPTETGSMISMSRTRLSSDGRPPVEVRGLPVEVDDSGWPCTKAGRQAELLVPPAVRYWPPGVVWPGWRGSVPGLTQLFAAPYCPRADCGGDGDEDDDDGPLGPPMRAMRVRQGIRMGDDELQVQAFMRGRTDAMRLGESGVQMAVVWTPEARDWVNAWESMEELTRMSFAEAEYYFDDGDLARDIDRREWLWYMNWRARLRRFRPIEGTPAIGSTPFSQYPDAVIH